MNNPFAGEATLVVDGQPRVCKLTLGALAELEAGLGAATLVELVERFEGGAFSSRDVMALLVAGLRGGGWRVTADELVSAEIAGGLLGPQKRRLNCWPERFRCPHENGLAGVNAGGSAGATTDATAVLGANPGRAVDDAGP